MGCFRQLFRSMLAPFKREQPRVLEIGPPNQFSQGRTTCLLLGCRHIDVSGQPRNSDGEERNDDRDSGLSAITQGDAPEPCSTDEHQTVSTRFRDRIRPTRWFRPAKNAAAEDTGGLVNK